MTDGSTTVTVDHRADPSQPVFISHSLADSRFAAVFAQELSHHGLKSWYADRDADRQYDYWAQVDQAIQAAGAVVVVISPALSQAPNVYAEVERVRRAGKPVVGLGISDQPGGGHGLGDIIGWFRAYGPEAGAQTGQLLFLLTDIYGTKLNEARPSRFDLNLSYPGEGGSEPYYRLPPGAIPSYPPPPEMIQPAYPAPPEHPAPPPAGPVPLGLRGRRADPAQPQPQPQPQPYQAQGAGQGKPPPWGLIIGGGFGLLTLIGGALALSGVFEQPGTSSFSRSASSSQGSLFDPNYLGGSWCGGAGERFTFSPATSNLTLEGPATGTVMFRYSVQGDFLTMTSYSGAGSTLSTLRKIDYNTMTISASGQGTETLRRC